MRANFTWKKTLSFFRPKSSFDKKIKSIVGYYPYNAFFYTLAFTHKSRVSNRKNDHKQSNERLEYLGDAILSAVISDYLYQNYEQMAEGQLSKLRSKIVSRESLNKLGSSMGLQSLLIANVNTRAMENSVLGNTLEALIGACYMDQGFGRCKNFILSEIIGKYLDMEQVIRMEVNYKSLVMEWGQKKKKAVTYHTINELGSGIQKSFTVALLIDAKIVTEATDSSKKKAEQQASKKFSEQINETSQYHG